MKVYIELNKLSDREIINIMQMFVFAWNGDTETKRNEWKALLNAFEQVRTSSAETDRIFNGIEYHEQCAFSFLVVRIVKDWDRLSFSHLYTRSCQRWNRENGLIMNDCVTELRDLGSNEKTIDYACNVDLENIEELYKAGDTDRLTELLYYSEDCDDDEQQCSYKVKAESKIRRCLERLSATESAAPEHTSTSTKTITENSKGAIPTESPSQKRLETIAEESEANYRPDIQSLQNSLRYYISNNSDGILTFTGSAKLYAYLVYKIKQRRGYASIDWESFMTILPLQKEMKKDTLKKYVSDFLMGRNKSFPPGSKKVDAAIDLLV